MTHLWKHWIVISRTCASYFSRYCEKLIEAVHFMLDEMVMNGCVVETNKQNIMAPITESRTQ